MLTLPLDVEVDGGWRATSAQMPGGPTSPLVLIALRNGSDEQFFRIDMHKRIMLDKPTADVQRGVLNTLIEQVGTFLRGEASRAA